MCVFAASLDVIESQQIPASLGDEGIEAERIEPRLFGQGLPAQRRERLPLVQADDRQGVTGRDRTLRSDSRASAGF